jgi:hypothetical protein
MTDLSPLELVTPWDFLEGPDGVTEMISAFGTITWFAYVRKAASGTSRRVRYCGATGRGRPEIFCNHRHRSPHKARTCAKGLMSEMNRRLFDG